MMNLLLYCLSTCFPCYLPFFSSFKSFYFSNLVPINALPLDTSTRESRSVFRLQEIVLNGDVPRVWMMITKWMKKMAERSYRITYSFTKSKKIYSFKLPLAINKSTSRVIPIQTFISFDQIYGKITIIYILV